MFADFSKMNFFKILSGIPSECQTVWIQNRPHVLLGLIWVQTICKGYQQKALAGEQLMHRACDLATTDFDCDICNHCNCFSITGMVGD